MDPPLYFQHVLPKYSCSPYRFSVKLLVWPVLFEKAALVLSSLILDFTYLSYCGQTAYSLLQKCLTASVASCTRCHTNLHVSSKHILRENSHKCHTAQMQTRDCVESICYQ